MSFLSLAKDLLFPRLCSACHATLFAYEEHICVKCQLNLPKLDANATELIKKFWGKLNVKNTHSFLQFTKNGPVQNILHDLKYRNKPELAEYIGKWFGNELRSKGLDKEIDLIIGVPLHPIKFKRRGYNQADHFAAGLSESLNVPYDTESLVRKKFTETQTNKSRYKRFENIQSVFEVKSPNNILGKRVALVDDVLTTGATLEVAGAELIKAGCKELSILTIAAAK